MREKKNVKAETETYKRQNRSPTHQLICLNKVLIIREKALVFSYPGYTEL